MHNGNKILKAAAPFRHPGLLNFKRAPFEAWKNNGGRVTKSCYPPRILHGAAFRWELPTIFKCRGEARLRFVEPVSMSFDTFPDYARYEIVPMIWDCWPQYFEKTCKWLKRHQVHTAIFTSSQTADRMRERLPYMNIIWCAEALNDSDYKKGMPLKERSIDVLEFGRSNENVVRAENLIKRGLNYICTKQDGKFVYTNEQLCEAMGKAKVSIALPRSMTQPEITGDVETLTQRYWECMFSRMVMVGHAPKELVDFIGYNPVVELKSNVSSEALVADVVEHIGDYQGLVDRNRETAERLGSWNVRMKWLMSELSAVYKI